MIITSNWLRFSVFLELCNGAHDDFNFHTFYATNAFNAFRNAFGDHHMVYADALLDKGFFLLNVDSINKSVEVYMVSSMNRLTERIFITTVYRKL